MFGWEFPPHISGGLGTACYGLSKSLAQQNIDIKFVVPKKYGKEDSSFLDIEGADKAYINLSKKDFLHIQEKIEFLQADYNIVPYISVEEYKNKFSDFKDAKFKNSSSNRMQLNISGKYGAKLIEEVYKYALFATQLGSMNDFDIIHAHDWLTYPCGIAAKAISGKPLIIHVHATEFDRSGNNINKAVFKIEQEGMKEADKIIAVSKLTKQTIVEKYKIPSDKIEVVYNAVEPICEIEKQKKHVKEKIVCFLGRITYQKGPSYFIDVAKRLLSKDSNVRFVMAGSGDMLNDMVDLVAELGISDKFHFCGFLKGKEISKLFSISDVFVMPSISEPFGIVPLEAMQCGVPVVISKSSGVSEILTNALKVDFWDVDNTANSIYALLHHKGISDLFKQSGKIEVDQLKWKNSASRLIDVYNNTLHTKHSITI